MTTLKIVPVGEKIDFQPKWVFWREFWAVESC